MIGVLVEITFHWRKCAQTPSNESDLSRDPIFQSNRRATNADAWRQIKPGLLRRQKNVGTALNGFTFLKQHCNNVHHRVALGIFAHGS
jgi:hypothetical protein